ncbi:signal peptide peptidase SppA [Rhodobiaceae bacterium]|nr:signal peptide peptidase SppA [Rhodobiaceae bacterium]
MKLLWSIIAYIPTFFIRALTVIIICIFILSLFSKVSDDIEKGTALFIPMNGILVEQAQEVNSFESFLGGSRKNEIELKNIINIIRAASNDKKIDTIVISLSNFIGGYPADIFYLSEALNNFKKVDGNKIIAIADQFSQASYIIASFADEIILHPSGGVLLTGWSSKRVFVKDFLDKLDVKVLEFSKGEYKSATEVFTRSSMSNESKESNSKLFNVIWKFTSKSIEKNRNLENGFIENYIQNALAQNHNNTSMAELALNNGLVDKLMTRVEVEKYLSDQFPDEKNDWKFIHYQDYEQDSPEKNKNIIGLVSIAGTILDGSQPRGSAGGDNISAMIKEARNEKNLKALVLRVNTPGGSAFASEIIREQVLAIKDRGIPIVVSMGGLAASGGYWISADSDYIFAHESSVTGSIGVAAILFDAQETIKKIGLNEDGVSNSPFTGSLNNGVLLSSPSEEVVDLIQGNVDRLYNDFIEIVANGRGISTEEANLIAKGRVWSGVDALEVGLIDQIGSLDDAIDKAKDLAAIKDYYLKEYDKTKNNISLIIEFLNLFSFKNDLEMRDNIYVNLKNELISIFKWSKNLNDRNQLYYICDECIIIN